MASGLLLGSTVQLTVTRAEDPSRILAALEQKNITFFPRTSEDEPETLLSLEGRLYIGEAEILTAIKSLEGGEG
jgi:hypothetical protein